METDIIPYVVLRNENDLGNDISVVKGGIKMPIIGLGTWQLKGESAENAVFNAIKLGYRHFDTASDYHNERAVGNGIKRAMNELGVERSDLFIATKLWNLDQVCPLESLEKSLQELGTDYLDLYYIHWPLPGVSIKAWKKLQATLGTKVKALGVSNYDQNDIEKIIAAGLPLPAVNQIEMSLFLRQKPLVNYCREKGIEVVAYSPLARGRRINDPKIEKMAHFYSRTPAQIMLRGLVQNGITVIPKASTLERLEENLGAVDFEMSDQDMQYIHSLNNHYHATFRVGRLSFSQDLLKRCMALTPPYVIPPLNYALRKIKTLIDKSSGTNGKNGS